MVIQMCRILKSSPEGVLQKKEEPQLISTRRGKLSIKAVVLGLTTKRWHIWVRNYIIHYFAAVYRSFSMLLRIESCIY